MSTTHIIRHNEEAGEALPLAMLLEQEDGIAHANSMLVMS